MPHLSDYEFFMVELPRKPIHTLDYTDQCQQLRTREGSRIRDLTKWSQALLMRQTWHIHTNPQLLVVEIYLPKYGIHSPINTMYYGRKEHKASREKRGLVRVATNFKEAFPGQIWNACLKASGVIMRVWNIPEQNTRPTEKLDIIHWPLRCNGEYIVRSGYPWLTENNNLKLSNKLSKYGKSCGCFKSQPTGKSHFGEHIMMLSQLAIIGKLEELDKYMNVRCEITWRKWSSICSDIVGCPSYSSRRSLWQ
ncbi:hypothetical protein Cgig2_001189 [Carnegiea gigantea]|uniref:Uncharacterized protein n=1 Tax=Carnegiea gigantea TaxID=171969 RepID=A0A9Q1K0T8_9CARY|nr:hypothetical protein Cgig2_001189 [Carnegiea gigantea]